MKRNALFLILVLISCVLYSQGTYQLVRLTPKQEDASISIDALKSFAELTSDTAIVFGILNDGTGAIIFKSKQKSWDSVWGKYSLFSSPLNINYDVLCEIMKNNNSLTGTFIQYNTHITKFNVRQLPQLQNSHYDYLKQLKKIGSVLLEGHFNNDDGGLLLIEGTIQKDVINSDPTIQSGLIIPEIIEGTFLYNGKCEND